MFKGKMARELEELVRQAVPQVLSPSVKVRYVYRGGLSMEFHLTNQKDEPLGWWRLWVVDNNGESILSRMQLHEQGGAATRGSDKKIEQDLCEWGLRRPEEYLTLLLAEFVLAEREELYDRA